MAKRLTDDEKRAILSKILESGKREPAFYFSSLCKRFPERSSGVYSDWTKQLYGVPGSEYFTNAGAVMNEEQKYEYTKGIMSKLKKRYEGKDPAPDYETLKSDNPDIDFYYIHIWAEFNSKLSEEEYIDFLAENGCLKKREHVECSVSKVTSDNKEISPAPKNNEATSSSAPNQWYLSSVPMKASVEAVLDDGNKYKYRTRRQVKKGDYIVIGRGFKSSGEMAKVTQVLDLSATKKTHTADALYSFCKNPTQEIIKKSASGIFDLNSYERIVSKYTLSPDNFAYVDSMVEILLNAATVLSFPKLAAPAALKKAAEIIGSKKTIPGFLFGDKMQNEKIYFRGYSFVDDSPTMTCFPEVVFSGYYPEWEESFYSISIWGKIEKIGVEKTKKMGKKLVQAINEEFYANNDHQFCIGKREGNYIFGCADADFEKLVNEDQEYQKACNELIFRSALSILIRGDFANLLEAFLSAKRPISGFVSSLVDYARTCKAEKCLDILKEQGYK